MQAVEVRRVAMFWIDFFVVFDPLLQSPRFRTDLQRLKFGQCRFKLCSKLGVEVARRIDYVVRFY